MQGLVQRLVALPSAGPIYLPLLFPGAQLNRRCYYSLPAQSTDISHAQHVSWSQLLLLNEHGVLPSVARHWDSRTAEVELRNAGAVRQHGAGAERPTAVQEALAKRHGLSLPPGVRRKAAAASLAAVLPPPLRSLAVLYGVLGYDGAVPPSAAAARKLMKQMAQGRLYAHALDTDLSPVSLGQMSELYDRLGYIGRPPFSYAAAQTLGVCLRVILADVEDEARLRPLAGLAPRQADLIRYLRTRRAPPGTRGMPAVMEVDLDSMELGAAGSEAGLLGSGSGSLGGAAAAAARRGVTRMAAARNILQLLQNHELSDAPKPDHVAALRSLGHAGPVPPCAGEALMLAQELRDRCHAPSPAQLAALRAAGYGAAVPPSAAAAPPPTPDSVAHVKAVLRVVRRADVDAATPATRLSLQRLAELRRAAPAAAAAAPPQTTTIATSASVATEEGGEGGVAVGLAPCPSQLEVKVATEELPLSEVMLERLLDLGWPSDPRVMPAAHGSGAALEEALVAHSARYTPPGAHLPSAVPPPLWPTHGSPGSAPGHGHGPGNGRGHGNDYGHGSGYGSGYGNGPYRQSAPSYSLEADAGGSGGGGGSVSGGSGSSYQPPREAQLRIADFLARLGSRDPAEALTKIQIRGLFPGAVSEWHLRSMCGGEAAHLLACLKEARRLVMDRVRTVSYDEYVERWAVAEAEGDWWGVEWLWL